MKKLIVGITDESSVVLLEGQLRHFKEKGFSTFLMGPYSERVREYCEREGCKHLHIRIKRDISVFNDILTLLQILIIFIQIRPDIINLGTPKVSLLGMIAGKLLGIRNRIYTCRGFRFEHEKGFKRKLLVAMEKITASCAHQIVCISPSVRKFGIENGLFRAESTIVIHKGSSNGLNLKRFSPESINQEELNILKKDLGFDGKFIFGTVTRLIDRKGVKELYEAFTLLSKKYSNIKMLIVGRIEDDQLSDNSIIEKLKSDRAVTMVGSQLNIPLYLSLMDVFVLPAWWEGFGNVYVQAAAMGIPVIGTTAIGAIDAVKDGFNGFQVPPKTIEPLVEKMEMLYLNKDLREKFGRNGLIWAKNFDSKIIWDGMEVLYNKR